MARTCLMCGAPLDVEEPEPESEESQGLPRWVRPTIVVVLALMILSAAGFGFYRIMTREPPPVTPSATPLPTRTPTRIPTLTSTAPPTPTPTPPPPRSHQVQLGETLSEIAADYDTTVDAIVTMNPEVDPELIQDGQVLLIPPASSQVDVPDPDALTATPADFIVHVVQPGETLSEIAEQMGVSMEIIRRANDMAPYDSTIQVNQPLIIPLGTPVPTPTPTKDPNATSTPMPPYPPPPLLNPADEAVFAEGDDPVMLQWASVGVLADDEWYEALLWQPQGGVVSATHRTRSTAWRVPSDLLDMASTDLRAFRWRVRVVQEVRDQMGTSYQEAGTATDIRTFYWQAPAPVSSPTARP